MMLLQQPETTRKVNDESRERAAAAASSEDLAKRFHHLSLRVLPLPKHGSPSNLNSSRRLARLPSSTSVTIPRPNLGSRTRSHECCVNPARLKSCVTRQAIRAHLLRVPIMACRNSSVSTPRSCVVTLPDIQRRGDHNQTCQWAEELHPNVRSPADRSRQLSHSCEPDSAHVAGESSSKYSARGQSINQAKTRATR